MSLRTFVRRQWKCGSICHWHIIGITHEPDIQPCGEDANQHINKYSEKCCRCGSIRDSYSRVAYDVSALYNQAKQSE